MTYILVKFESNQNFPDRFSENPQIPNFMKILPMGEELFHMEKQTDGQTAEQTRQSSWPLFAIF